MDGWVDGWMDGWMVGWMGGWMDDWMDFGWVDGCMDGLVSGWMDGRIDRYADMQTDKWLYRMSGMMLCYMFILYYRSNSTTESTRSWSRYYSPRES